jgi:hypothetical protein
VSRRPRVLVQGLLPGGASSRRPGAPACASALRYRPRRQRLQGLVFQLSSPRPCWRPRTHCFQSPKPGALARASASSSRLAPLAVPMCAPVAGFARVSGLVRVSDVLSAAASPTSRAPPRFEHLARRPRLGSYAHRPSSLAPQLHVLPAAGFPALPRALAGNATTSVSLRRRRRRRSTSPLRSRRLRTPLLQRRPLAPMTCRPTRRRLSRCTPALRRSRSR